MPEHGASPPEIIRLEVFRYNQRNMNMFELMTDHTHKQNIVSAVLGRGVLQRKCDTCSKMKPLLQPAAAGPTPERVPPIVHDVLRSPGQPLDPATRAFMEPRFDHNFSRVRVHTDARAAESAGAVGALAYTVGQHIVFGTRQHAPWSDAGRRLMGHELTHVVQQSQSLGLKSKLAMSLPENTSEREADAVAGKLVSHANFSIPGINPAEMHVSRKEQKDKPLPKGAIPSSKLDPLDTPEKTKFMRDVYDAQMQRSIGTMIFMTGLPDSLLGEVEDKKKMHFSAVFDAKALLAQARLDLAAQKAASDSHAIKVKKIGINSAYRSMKEEKVNWRNAFLTNYKRSKNERATLDVGEFVNRMMWGKAIPGFSNHIKGLAIDFMTEEKGLGKLGPFGRAKWQKSWFWSWLVDHAAAYNFKPLSGEEWHWDYFGLGPPMGDYTLPEESSALV
jgi:hypothetical protein